MLASIGGDPGNLNPCFASLSRILQFATNAGRTSGISRSCSKSAEQCREHLPLSPPCPSRRANLARSSSCSGCARTHTTNCQSTRPTGHPIRSAEHILRIITVQLRSVIVADRYSLHLNIGSNSGAKGASGNADGDGRLAEGWRCVARCDLPMRSSSGEA